MNVFKTIKLTSFQFMSTLRSSFTITANDNGDDALIQSFVK